MGFLDFLSDMANLAADATQDFVEICNETTVSQPNQNPPSTFPNSNTSLRSGMPGNSQQLMQNPGMGRQAQAQAQPSFPRITLPNTWYHGTPNKNNAFDIFNKQRFRAYDVSPNPSGFYMITSFNEAASTYAKRNGGIVEIDTSVISSSLVVRCRDLKNHFNNRNLDYSKEALNLGFYIIFNITGKDTCVFPSPITNQTSVYYSFEGIKAVAVFDYNRKRVA